MTTLYPGTSIDDTTTMPVVIDNTTSVLASHHNNQSDAIIAVETKLGTGSSTPTSGKFLIGNTTAGSSQWKTITASDLPDLSATHQTILTHLSDETGTGLAVFNNTPTLITPVLGVATATSINKVAITAPATSATLTIANGKTLTVSDSTTLNTNAITLAGTEILTMAAAKNVTFADAFTTSGAFPVTLTATASTSVTLPTTGTLVSTDQTAGQTIGATGARLTKLWATDITCTNAITGSITGNAATVTTNANLTGVITSVGNATSIASQTGTGSKFVVDTSPTLVTPILGIATGTSLGLTQTALTSTPTDGLTLINSTAALVGETVQISPRLRMRGTAWDSDDSVSRTLDWTIENLPATATTVVSTLRFGHSLDGAAYTFPMTLTNAGALTISDNFVVGDNKGIYNVNTTGRGLFTIGSATVPTTLKRDLADAVACFAINQNHASSTGYILDLKFGDVSKAHFDKDGNLTAPLINGLTVTANGTNTLNVAAGKTLTVSNTVTLTATDGSTLAIGTGGTLGTGAYATIANYAPLSGPTFTGTVTLPKTLEIQDTTGDHQYVLAVSELTADRTITLPLLAGNDEFVFKDFIQTLTNKTLTSPTVNTPTLVLADTSPTADGSIGFDRTGEDLQIGDGSASQVVHMGAWVSYVPSLTNITLGSGTLSASYCTVGKRTRFRIYLLLAADSSVSGNMTFTFPTTLASNQVLAGHCIYIDTGTGYVVGDIFNDGILRAFQSDGTYVTIAPCNATVPFTWTTNDKVYVEGEYETA